MEMNTFSFVVDLTSLDFVLSVVILLAFVFAIAGLLVASLFKKQNHD